MEFRLFGEVQLQVADQPLDVGTPRQQAVLAVLAVDSGRPVPIETLIDRVWGENPPEQARNVLYSLLSRNRRLVRAAGASGIPRRTTGYVLDVDPDSVDLHRFTRLVERGKDIRLSDVDRSAALTEALGMWTGVPLAGIPGEWAEQVRLTWNRRRLDAAVHWGELELRLGRPQRVIDTVSDLITAYPLAEPLEALLMRALHAAGRDAEAVDRYTAVRERLADHLGADPGPELQALHRKILRGELPSSHRPVPVTTPAQLPPDTPVFAGRTALLRRLDSLAKPSTATPIVVLCGTAGVGKTTAAIHWAHTAKDEFADGQLYVNLRGFDPSGTPVTVAEAMRGFLEALDVLPDQMPTSLEAQAGLYRSLLSQRRVLVVLDNARDADQVRPLLPGASSCMVLVTSRDQLTGLATAGAHPVRVELLDDAEAHSLLGARLGASRIAAEPAVIDEIIALCAHLPLALAVVAARAVTNPRFSLATLAGQLRDARGSLDEFAGTDPATDPRAVFSWSYHHLSAPAARLFRLLGLHSGPDIGIRAAASLAGLAVGKVRPLLTELAQTHLVAEPMPSRYACHDLLHAYAAELAEISEPAAEREEALHRLLGHYSHTAYHADGFLSPRREVPPPLTPLPPGAESEPILKHSQALAWFKTEHRVLLTAVRQDARFDNEVSDLVRWTQLFLENQGHWHDELDVLALALAAARRLGDERKQAFVRCQLGRTHIWFGRHADAAHHLQIALDLYEAVDDIVGKAYVHYAFCWLADRRAAVADGLRHAKQALELFQATEHEAGQAKALNAVGWFTTLSGDHASAIGHCREALKLQERLGDQIGAAQTWHSLGYSYKELGDGAQAIACYEAAVELYTRNGYPITEARVLIDLGDVRNTLGDEESARTDWRRAHDILVRLSHPEADEVRARLAQIQSRQSTSQE